MYKCPSLAWVQLIRVPSPDPINIHPQIFNLDHLGLNLQVQTKEHSQQPFTFQNLISHKCITSKLNHPQQWHKCKIKQLRTQEHKIYVETLAGENHSKILLILETSCNLRRHQPISNTNPLKMIRRRQPSRDTKHYNWAPTQQETPISFDERRQPLQARIRSSQFCYKSALNSCSKYLQDLP